VPVCPCISGSVRYCFDRRVRLSPFLLAMVVVLLSYFLASWVSSVQAVVGLTLVRFLRLLLCIYIYLTFAWGGFGGAGRVGGAPSIYGHGCAVDLLRRPVHAVRKPPQFVRPSHVVFLQARRSCLQRQFGLLRHLLLPLPLPPTPTGLRHTMSRPNQFHLPPRCSIRRAQPTPYHAGG
jgi:hypothetical protein